MNKKIYFKIVLIVVILLIFPTNAKAFWGATYEKAATVSAHVEPAGSGKVYVATEASSFSNPRTSDWETTKSDGGNSSSTKGASLPVFIYAQANNGYVFLGWSATSTGSLFTSSDYADSYTSGNIHGVKKNYTAYSGNGNGQEEYDIYARFSPIPYTITYLHGDKGTGDSYQSMYNIAGTGTVTTPGTASGFTPFTGYQFNNKWVVSNATGNWSNGTEIASNYSFANNKMYGDITLTALWEHKPYSITYVVGSGGSLKGGSSPQTYYIDEATTLRYAQRTGYTFYGWKVTSITDPTECNWSVGDVIPYTSGSSPVVPAGKYGHITLTAQWEPLPADITITVSGLDSNDSAIFTISSGGTVLYTVVVPGSSPSVTVKNLTSGVDYDVNPKAEWCSWKYDGTNATETFALGASGHTCSFTYTKKSSLKNNDEKANVNWHD